MFMVVVILFFLPLLPMIIVSLRCVRNYGRTSVFIVVSAILLSFVLTLTIVGEFINFGFFVFIMRFLPMILCLLPMVIAPLVLAYKYKREDIPSMVLADIASVIGIVISIVLIIIIVFGSG